MQSPASSVPATAIFSSAPVQIQPSGLTNSNSATVIASGPAAQAQSSGLPDSVAPSVASSYSSASVSVHGQVSILTIALNAIANSAVGSIPPTTSQLSATANGNGNGIGGGSSSTAAIVVSVNPPMLTQNPASGLPPGQSSSSASAVTSVSTASP